MVQYDMIPKRFAIRPYLTVSFYLHCIHKDAYGQRSEINMAFECRRWLSTAFECGERDTIGIKNLAFIGLSSIQTDSSTAIEGGRTLSNTVNDDQTSTTAFACMQTRGIVSQI